MDKRTRGLENNVTSGDHPNYCIIEIDENTEKKSWRLEETWYHSNSSERPSANIDVKNSRSNYSWNNYNNNNMVMVGWVLWHIKH